MKNYLIDGNNLIGKIKSLYAIQKKDGQSSREKLVLMLDRYLAGRKIKTALFFDGFENLSIPSSKMKIIYSNNLTADDKIKSQIDRAKNPKLLTVITSDLNLIEFAKVNSCSVIKSEDFHRMIKESEQASEEAEIQRSIGLDEIKKIFGVDE